MPADLMTCARCKQLARLHPTGECHDCRHRQASIAAAHVARAHRRAIYRAARERRLSEALDLEAERSPDSFEPPERTRF